MDVRAGLDIRYIWLLAGLTGITILSIKLWRLCTTRLDPHEPPIVRHIVPYAGHLWGLLRHSHDYVNSLW